MIRHFQVRVIPGAGLGAGPVELLYDIVADAVYEGPKTLRLAYPIFTQGNQHPYIGLLAEIFDGFRGKHPRSQFDPQKLVKIRDKMLFRRGISLAEALHVFPGECEEIHVVLEFVLRSISAPSTRSNLSRFGPEQ
jgi:hypothetical protein